MSDTENQESVDIINAPGTDSAPPELEAEPLNEPAPQAPNPLSPGGKRFEQVYAQSKQAQRDLAAERERTAALEARLVAVETRQTAAPKEEEYTAAQLEAFIAENRITRADASDYLQKQTLRKAVQTAKQEIREESTENDRLSRLTGNVHEYLQHLPAIADVNSADRIRLEEEYEWVANVQGKQVSKLTPVEKQALQLTALRNVFGSIDSVKKRITVTDTPTSQQEIPGGTPPRRSGNPDQELLNSLSPFQVQHYKKMMGAGRYAGGWKDVVAELKFNPNNRTKLVKK